ncbi:MAG: polyketide biosynthesis methyltransferase [Pseudonocardiaceae bacterium]|nr:polyketide biosynthesis methyltransferase [Pseudonocardiaceae bacterium]
MLCDPVRRRGHNSRREEPLVSDPLDSGATSAGIYDYLLNGGYHTELDRRAAEEMLRLFPEGAALARQNRSFVRRAVRFLGAHSDVRQFVDIGSGYPTGGHVHEIAEKDPLVNRRPVHVVYIDNDLSVVEFGRSLLAEYGTADRHTYICGDFRDPDLWKQVLATGRIDPDKPVCLLAASMLHFIEDAWTPLEAIKRRLCAGSYLLVSHVTDAEGAASETDPQDRSAVDVYTQSTAHYVGVRSREQIERFFHGWQMIEPGLVPLPEWRPEMSEPVGEPADHSRLVGGLARKVRIGGCH